MLVRSCLQAMVAVSLMLTVAACSSTEVNDSTSPSVSEQSSTSQPTTSSPTPTTPSTASESTGDEVAVGGQIIDDELGFTVDVISFIDNASLAGFEPPSGQRLVLVQYTFTASTLYYGVPQPSSFYIEGTQFNTPSTTIADEAATAAGYTMLSTSSSPDEGEPLTGWLAYTVSTDQTDLTILYKRQAATTQDGATIEATTMTLPLK